MGQDYDVSDTITQPDEDARFCDLVHLVIRSFNTLKEVGSQNDMDNSHMMAIIEQKMCPDDRTVWSRDLERQGGKGILRATAPLSSSKSVFSFQVDTPNQKWHKYWYCKNSSHWPDTCPKFASLGISTSVSGSPKITMSALVT